MNDPKADRPTMPDGYGIPESVDGVLTWERVERALIESSHIA